MFTKDDLKVGMLVELKNGRTYILLETREGNCVFISEPSCFREQLDYYNKSLENINHSDYNIVKVWGLPSNDIGYGKGIFNNKIRKLLWERKETLELTLDEIADKYGVDVNNLKIKK